MLKTVLAVVVLTWTSTWGVSLASGAVWFYDSESAWRGDLPGWPIGEYPFDAPHLESIIGHEPGHGENLGHPLEFPADITGLPADFTLNPDPPASQDLYYEDSGNPYGPSLSIGWSDPPYDDDWAISFGEGVYAFAVDVLDSNEEVPDTVETFKVFGPGDVLLGTLNSTDDKWPVGTNTFLGVISTEPIALVFFDDEVDADNITLGKIWLTPEPGTLSLLALGGLVLGCRRRQQPV